MPTLLVAIQYSFLLVKRKLLPGSLFPLDSLGFFQILGYIFVEMMNRESCVFLSEKYSPASLPLPLHLAEPSPLHFLVVIPRSRLKKRAGGR